MIDNGKDFPYEIKALSSEENEEINESMKGLKLDYIRVGPKGYLLAKNYEKDAANVYNMPIRSDDVFVVSYPKSGTTWTQDLVWLVANNLNYEKAKNVILDERFPFIEARMFPLEEFLKLDNIDKTASLNDLFAPKIMEEIEEMRSPRFIKSHLPLSILPPTLLDMTKVVYVTRDPRDVAVSFYHHNKFMRMMAPDVEFKTYWNHFLKNQTLWSPYFDHLMEAWEKRQHPNLLFLFYEELSTDLPASIRRVAKFLGKELTDGEVAGLQEHLKFDNFKNNKSVNLENLQKKGMFRSDGAFVRKGKMGGWRDYFDEEMTAQADKWIEDNLRDTDFRFSHM